MLAWALLERSVIVYLPTGSGKTLVAALLLRAVAEANQAKRVVFVVDKIPLLYQQVTLTNRTTFGNFATSWYNKSANQPYKPVNMMLVIIIKHADAGTTE
jgi:superfamily II DNA or RNA helicase